LAAHSGFSSAAVPRLIRETPVSSAASSDASSRMPPDSSIFTPRTERITLRITAPLLPRPNAASRSTRWIHSAPWLTKSAAASVGSP
jgi:hypothetical protein